MRGRAGVRLINPEVVGTKGIRASRLCASGQGSSGGGLAASVLVLLAPGPFVDSQFEFVTVCWKDNPEKRLGLPRPRHVLAASLI
jgi:hypothetical protein